MSARTLTLSACILVASTFAIPIPKIISMLEFGTPQHSARQPKPRRKAILVQTSITTDDANSEERLNPIVTVAAQPSLHSYQYLFLYSPVELEISVPPPRA